MIVHPAVSSPNSNVIQHKLSYIYYHPPHTFLSCPQDFHGDFVKYFVESTVKVSVEFLSPTRRVTPSKKGMRFFMVGHDLTFKFVFWVFFHFKRINCSL